MFDKKEINGILEKFQKRISEVNNPDKIPVLDTTYLSFLSKYKGLEITPDIQVFGYEDALRENKYIKENFSAIYNYLWIIGRSGQGDEWFISKEKSTILFYDHDNGEYTSVGGFQDFNISFLEFLQAAFMYRELEEQLDNYNDDLPAEIRELFISNLEKISVDFYAKYPYKYF